MKASLGIPILAVDGLRQTQNVPRKQSGKRMPSGRKQQKHKICTGVDGRAGNASWPVDCVDTNSESTTP